MARIQPIRDWHERMALNRGGWIDSTSPSNLLLVLRENTLFKDAFAWNDISREVEFTRDVEGIGKRGEKVDLARHQLLTIWLERHEQLRCRYAELDKTLYILAQEHRFNAIQDELNGLVWDGRERLQSWLADYLGVAGSRERIASAGSRFLLTAVARVLTPACGIDSFWFLQAMNLEPVHEAFEILFGRYYNRWVDPMAFITPLTIGPENRGRWCLNILEGETWVPSLGTRIKTIARRLQDPMPAQYLKYCLFTPRTTIFIAIVRKLPDDMWFKKVNAGDPFYERLATGRVSAASLKRDRGQLFAEAVALFRSGRRWIRDAWQEPERPNALREKVLEYTRDKYEVSMREVVEATGKRYDPTNIGVNKAMGILLASLGMRRLNVAKFGTPSVYRYRWVK